MTLDDKIHGIRLRVMQQAEQRGVSAVCRELGIPRTLLYRWRKRLERYGADGLHPRRRQARPGRPGQLSPQVERLILSVAVAQATWGCSRLAAHLAHRWGLRVAPSTIQRLLRRTKLATRRQRLTVLEHAAGLLTERTRRALLRARYGASRHVEASTPGELVCLDTFYIGNLKGVAKVCGRSRPAMRPPPMESPGCCPSSRPRPRPTSCSASCSRFTASRPRHAWTNGFVERLQGTILEEHWRIQFRRRYFTGRAALARSLEGFLRFYNEQRPHQGYRLRGRTPATLFWGAVASAR